MSLIPMDCTLMTQMWERVYRELCIYSLPGNLIWQLFKESLGYQRAVVISTITNVTSPSSLFLAVSIVQAPESYSAIMIIETSISEINVDVPIVT